MAKNLSLPLALALAATLTTASGVAAEPIKITISYSQKVPDMLPLEVASAAGYFTKHGVDVTLQYLPSEQGIPALLTGQVQMAAIGGSDAVSAEAAGAKLTFVLTLSPVETFQFWARPQFAKPAALKGQTVGVTSATGSLYAATLLALKELGLAPTDVALTPLGSVINVNNALLAGSIAAAASHPPATYQFQTHGYIDLVDLPKKRIPSISDGLLATDPYLRANPKIIQAVVDAVMDGLRREKSDKAYAESVMSKAYGVKDPKILDFTYDFYVGEVLAPGPLPEIAQLEENRAAMKQTNPKVSSVDVAAMIDQSFVKTAQP